jgi:hypothetical protein
MESSPSSPAVAALAVPIVVVVVESFCTNAMKEREVSGKFVESRRANPFQRADKDRYRYSVCPTRNFTIVRLALEAILTSRVTRPAFDHGGLEAGDFISRTFSVVSFTTPLSSASALIYLTKG